jgi:hypothetical protein
MALAPTDALSDALIEVDGSVLEGGGQGRSLPTPSAQHRMAVVY